MPLRHCARAISAIVLGNCCYRASRQAEPDGPRRPQRRRPRQLSIVPSIPKAAGDLWSMPKDRQRRRGWLASRLSTRSWSKRSVYAMQFRHLSRDRARLANVLLPSV